MRSFVKGMRVRFEKVFKQGGCIGIITMALYTASCFTISLSDTCFERLCRMLCDDERCDVFSS